MIRLLLIILYLYVNIITFSLGYKSFVIKPAGLKGYYMLGISKYIKDNYDLTNWKYYGCSAGAWTALYLSCKKHDKLISDTKELNQFSYYDLYDLERTIKKSIIKNFNISDFDVEKINIGLSIKRKKLPLLRKSLINKFENLDDLLEGCISSSHLPFISNGDFFYKYRNMKTIDGGFFINPYVKKPDFVMSSDIWNNKKIDKFNRIYNMDIEVLINEGYDDAKKHKEELDNIFNN